MKSIISILSILIFIMFLIACSNNKPEAEFKGTITEIIGESAIVSADEGEDIRSSGELVEVNLSKNKEVEFNVGDRVRVGYDGPVQEKYPLGINTVFLELLENEN